MSDQGISCSVMIHGYTHRKRLLEVKTKPVERCHIAVRQANNGNQSHAILGTTCLSVPLLVFSMSGWSQSLSNFKKYKLFF